MLSSRISCSSSTRARVLHARDRPVLEARATKESAQGVSYVKQELRNVGRGVNNHTSGNSVGIAVKLDEADK